MPQERAWIKNLAFFEEEKLIRTKIDPYPTGSQDRMYDAEKIDDVLGLQRQESGPSSGRSLTDRVNEKTCEDGIPLPCVRLSRIHVTTVDFFKIAYSHLKHCFLSGKQLADLQLTKSRQIEGDLRGGRQGS